MFCEGIKVMTSHVSAIAPRPAAPMMNDTRRGLSRSSAPVTCLARRLVDEGNGWPGVDAMTSRRRVELAVFVGLTCSEAAILATSHCPTV